MNVEALRDMIIRNSNPNTPIPVGTLRKIAANHGITDSWATVRNHCEALEEDGLLKRIGEKYEYVAARHNAFGGNSPRSRYEAHKGVRNKRRFMSVRSPRPEQNKLTSTHDIGEARAAIEKLAKRVEGLEAELRSARTEVVELRTKLANAEATVTRQERKNHKFEDIAREAVEEFTRLFDSSL